jgi:hypothetical protein
LATFSRIHIESILEPNRTIAPSYQTVEFILRRAELSGVLIAAETACSHCGQSPKTGVCRSDLSEQRTRSVSVMPEGLENGWTTEEFIDLVAFLVSAPGRDKPIRRALKHNCSLWSPPGSFWMKKTDRSEPSAE